MEGLLIASRALHFAAAISLAGLLAFELFVADPALRHSGADSTEAAAALRRRLRVLAWAGLGVALASGAGWLTAVAANMSGEPLAAVLWQGTALKVLIHTQFGEDWLLRLALAVLLAACLAVPRMRALRWLALLLAAALLASLAWAGHGAATPGASGKLHLAGDIAHLLAAGLWLGMLPPLQLLLSAASRGDDARWAAAARLAARRFARPAVGSVAVLLAGGLVNTWFLAGTVPALVGTEYGRLLLAKIGLFVAMLLVAAVNLLRLTPRLAESGAAVAGPTIAQLRRNAAIETLLGLGVAGIVGVLGTLPPGLHAQPGWPLPFRIEPAALSLAATLLLVVLATLAGAGVVLAVAAAAAGRYRRAAGLAGGCVLCLGLACIVVRPAIAPAYPTSFYAPAEPYAAPSVMRGAKVYAEYCAACHGRSGRGDGPASASLTVRPASLIEPHLFAHTQGDLFWWVSHGRDNGAMPGFAEVLAPGLLWDAINFVRARAAGVLAQRIGPEIVTQSAPQLPDFAFETAGDQQTLRNLLAHGPVLLVLFAPPAPAARLAALAAADSAFQAAGLRILAVDLGEPGSQPLPFAGDVAPDVAAALALFRSPQDGGETELLLDRNGDVRARWTGSGELPDPDALLADAERAARFPIAAPAHAGHAH
jgi:putative copper resistance protein D